MATNSDAANGPLGSPDPPDGGALLTVVFTGFPLTAPARPISVISRATVHLATVTPSRFNCRQTLRTPWTPAGRIEKRVPRSNDVDQ